ncbi:AAA domain (dynein-related subfamily) [Legionella busanensis]|uniref:AAA domain (Dynein-related subfamily) n=1 Tax=Legionella busanensis TaxID=190655 RepID=A0A378JUH7_9GAMM|nr:AAA family ATPase [Legionella busanensis]STX51862.1 AAA domain (dynein-related subfamily) [Legionella busanensis]
MSEDSFYFTNKTEGKVFSRAPQGKLIVNRLLKNQAPFKKTHAIGKSKPKSLIIADWTLLNLEEWEIEEIIQKLTQLIKDGFPVYLWQDGEILAMNDRSIRCLKNKSVRQLITPTTRNRMIATANSQHHLIKDQIKILNKFELNQLLKTSTDSQNQQLYLSDLRSFSEKTSILAIIRQAVPPFNAVIEDTSSVQFEGLLSILSKEMPVYKQNKRLWFDRARIDELLRPGTISLENIRLSSTELNFVEKLTIDFKGEFKAEELTKLLSYFPQLRSLTLKGVSLSIDFQNLSALAAIKSLSLLKITTKLTNLEALISACSLKSLALEEVELTDTETLAGQLNLTSLNTLKIVESPETLRKIPIKTILQQATSLKALELNEEYPLANIDIPLNCLKDLILPYKRLYLLDLTNLSIQAPAIEKLDLSEAILNSDNNLQDICFSSLRELHADHSNLTIANLIAILKDAHNLELLDLIGCYNLEEDDTLLTGSFKQLKTLKLKNITAHNLATILTQAKKLEILVLGESGNFTYNSPEEIELNFLNKLELQGLKLSSPNSFAYTILNKAEALTSLQLSNCVIDNNTTQGLNLSRLKKLTLKGSYISEADLNNILKNTNDLEYLELHGSYSESITFIDFTKNVNFNHLRSFYLKNNDLKISDLETILKQAGELEILDLSNCQGLNFAFQNDHSFKLAKLEKLILTSTDISLDNLKAILRAAPNLLELNIVGCNNLLIDADFEKFLNEQKVLKVFRDTEKNSTKSAVNSYQQTTHESVASHSLEDSQLMDANTKLDTNKKYNLKQTFFPLDAETPTPDIRLYRKQVYNNFVVNPEPCSLDKAFTLNNVGDPYLIQPSDIEQLASVEAIIKQGQALVAKEKAKQSGIIYYYGQQELVLSPKGVALDSWVAHELLTHYHLNPAVPGVELKYSERDNLYYLYGPQDTSVNISFLLKIPPQPPLSLDQAAYCERMQKFFQEKFTDGALQYATVTPTGKDYLEEIIKQRKGACRHRTLAFRTTNEHLYGQKIPTRYVGNTSHAFAEVFLSNQWHKLDLGGYPATYTIDDTNHPDKILNAKKVETIKAAKHASKLENLYAKYLATWEKVKPEISSVKHYCQHVAKEGRKKTLIEFANSEAVHTLQISLQDYCKHTTRPHFYINSPDDLVCSAPFIKRQGEVGMIQKGPGGPLYDFLETYRTSKTPIYLIVNYDNFDADDIVRFNALIDKTPHADGTFLPANTQVIGLINTKKQECYQGEDFYSRFDTIETCPLTSEVLIDELNQRAPLPTITELNKLSQDDNAIDLYHASDWQERLLGYWAVKGNQLTFIEGELQTALKKNMPLNIKNGPWDNPAFKQFWQQALALGYIDYEGKRINLPKEFKLKGNEGYDWSHLVTHITLSHHLNTQAHVLNPGQFSIFFNQYNCQTEQLIMEPGLVAQYAAQDLTVQLTRELTDDQWAMLLATCQQHQVKLTIHVVPGIKLPDVLNQPNFIKVPQAFQTWQGAIKESITAIQSDDISTTIHQLITKNPDYRVIDVSECEPSDLLNDIHTEFNNEQGLIFQSYERALLNAIKDGTPIILKGHFSDELIDALAPILLSHLNKLKPGQLVLVSDKNHFSYLPITQVHNVSSMDKWSLLQRLFPTDIYKIKDETLFMHESFDTLYSRLLYLHHHPNEINSDLNWAGLHGLSGDVRLKEFDAANSVSIAKDFDKQRLAAVNAVFAYSPYVFLTGLTGVGKSTFVEKQFKNKNHVNLYQGLGNLLAWAQDDELDKQKILFIDEANLLNTEFTAFKGLFNIPPTILINGVIRKLSPNHKIIFAGNPLNYGDERHLASFFAEHGRAVIFDPMPQEYIYENILKPVFAGSKLNKENILQVSRELLNVYRFLCECSGDRVLISPREVQMMALFVASYLQNQPNLSLDELRQIAKLYGYKIAVDNVPVENRLTFDAQFKPNIAPIERDTETAIVSKEFLLTPSRRPAWQQLLDLLALRTYKQQGINDVQKYGGLGGLILEGDPGTGKSELVIAALLSQGYQKVSIHDTTKPLSDNIFYHVPVSLSLEEKRACLLKAFNEGAVVVIDEINSSPMMERLINDLLMGFNEKKERPNKPGFLIIGTQNPVTMSGRRPASDALARRLIKCNILPYPDTEIEAILRTKNLDQHQVTELIGVYNTQVNKAMRENLLPAPTFRNLLRLADSIVIGQNRGQQEIDLMEIEDEVAVESNQPRKRKSMDSRFFPTRRQRLSPVPKQDPKQEASLDEGMMLIDNSSAQKSILDKGSSLFKKDRLEGTKIAHTDDSSTKLDIF